MTFERPRRRNGSQSNTNESRNNSHGDGGNRGNRGGGGGGGQPPVPSPWINPENPPKPDSGASFVEYLRWMRWPEAEYKDSTKLQILQMACEQANYSERLKELTERTKLIAENSFKVQCPWRIRVGGHRGPESILLPAFDALGLPYIPSSTLRGVARTQAIREIVTQQQIQWKDAEKQVAPWFGSLEGENPEHRSGKVVFLDAYPEANQGPANILTVDMANNIWKWEGNSIQYSPNPNPFLSLEKPFFIIGLRLASGCEDHGILEKVKHWLITGLQGGVGSQVNSGYGQLNPAGRVTPQSEFFQVDFILQGQLIHGGQKFRNLRQPYINNHNNNHNNLRPDTINHGEVRPVAFKSMLRYWFRTFALGVLDPTQVQEWEGKIFGTITPEKKYGWLMVRVLKGRITTKEPQRNNDPVGEQEGTLTLNYSPEIPENQKNNLQKLAKNLAWLMFHLGGVGQGARRPCYSRGQTRPYVRGSTLIPDTEDKFWKLPNTPQEFQRLFRQRLEAFYQGLQGLGVNFNHRQLKNCGKVNSFTWFEALDINGKIIVVSNRDDGNKGYALEILHKYFHQLERPNYTEAKNLCGGVRVDYPFPDRNTRREVIPSPVWIADLEKYQVVTVFGANEHPRKKYLEMLENRVVIFPF
ncbi:RAMP superfamily CRISPR-associated protein [Umezakia ovalisporum]|uniref:RAMP superfamily CRISPR-associated protein n=1 Tax=Umezakia ovalisporum FSS-43 TaxID=2740520 RepID=A0ABT6K8C7_9CYAN|nr:RAMP superfamily CRISPR-associated protein [Umezakia ovalisporum]MDH6058663.1 RAMP superfamily CRISPR-associated protein [Umezakia ovalisporum FSS-43]MDH6071612.1 RAMP superfamily CRISPR-associated protein [Umezakia ovalisporum CobakiLakeA]MDH6082936.1 RAMP superfamily CRISPR-associated protein [Umezakia ovalisporum FSS-44]MDH6096530.1 RAMP superfamily CRISPR-associated protein [Umezakia ovalisporum CobakiLakeB]